MYPESETMPRFHPPRIPVTPELAWLLSRAFADRQPTRVGPFEGTEALRLARGLGMSARIATRAKPEELLVEVGEEACQALQRERTLAVALEMQRDRALRTLTEVAASLTIPLVLLKGMALRQAGVIAAGSRLIGDVDVLTDSAQAEFLHAALIERGYEKGRLEGVVHLPRLESPTEGAIEIHEVLLGVRSRPRHSVRLADLREADLLEPLPDLQGECYRPTNEALTAHLLVHALVQHGLDPREYRLIQVFADLIDLGWGDSETKEHGLVAHRWIRDEIDLSEIQAVSRLCANLREGRYRDSKELSNLPEEDAILAHALASRSHPLYIDSLRLRWLRPQLSDLSRPAQIAGLFRRSFFPTRPQLDHTYGSTTHWLGYLWRRISHPVAKLTRLLGSIRSSALVRRSR